MKFGVVTFPGSNCDQDMIYVLESLMGKTVERLWHKDNDLKNVDFVVLPGGFSYGDYLRSGAISRFSPIMNSVIEHCEKGGYALGVCNGFQILCEAGLLPGALLHNNNQKFVCKNQYLSVASNQTLLTRNIELGQVLNIPIAHGEGRFFASKEDLDFIEENNQVLFKYCNEKGEMDNFSNPNGSEREIAGICNNNQNVFGMMPHPERAADEELGNTDGLQIFQSICNMVNA